MTTKTLKMPTRPKTPKSIRRVRFIPDKPRKTMSYYRRMVIDIYTRKYVQRFNKPPFSGFVQRQIEADNGKYRKYNNMFEDIVFYLLVLREENGGWDEMRALIDDYMDVVFNYYHRFSRTPNINQMGTGPTNVFEFEGWISNEIDNGFGYWTSQEVIEQVKEDAKDPYKFRRDDPLMDKISLLAGEKPYWRPYRTLSKNGEIVEDGVEKIYDPIGRLVAENPL